MAGAVALGMASGASCGRERNEVELPGAMEVKAGTMDIATAGMERSGMEGGPPKYYE